MEQFFEQLQQKFDKGELEVAVTQCKKSFNSFVRGYTAYAALKGWDAEQVVLRFNKQFLDSAYDEEKLKKEVEFYIKSLHSIPQVKQRLKTN